MALLRGINVGGKSVVKMDRLRELFAELGLRNVRSYIQSGNVFFEAPVGEGARAELRTQIETHLAGSLGFGPAVCLRTVTELEQVLALEPFAGVEVTGDTRLAVNFLVEPATELVEPSALPVLTPDGGYELVAMTPSELFVVWRLKDGRPSNSYGHFEKRFGVSTTRFWHTAAKILEAAKKG